MNTADVAYLTAGDSLQQGENPAAGCQICVTAWSLPRDGAYLLSPVLYQGLLYVTKTNGAFSAFDAQTGERVYQDRLGNGATAFTASSIAADGKVYFTSEDGDVYVVKAGREFELLSMNPLGGIAMATPAVSEGTMYFRTSNRLIAIK